MAWDDKNYFWTCKDCRNWHDEGRKMATCRADGHVHDHYEEMCANFETKDGKRPRFCRFALSVDEMAKGIVVQFYACKGWIVAPIKQVFIEYEDAVAAAKAWLMEVV